jgi:S1-C subfamily serine protease
MTSGQIAEGQRLARQFKPRKALELGKVASGSDILDSSPSEMGTGFFITSDGYLVTSGHVVGAAAQIRLVRSTGIISARVVQMDAANDLALLKATGQFAALPVASSRSVALGRTVATVGFPDPGLQGFSPKLAKGEVAALTGAADDARYFQISAPLQPGNSGGALVDECANVVGIVSAKLDAATALASSGALPENVNYAIKSSFLLSFLESVPEISSKLRTPNVKEQKFQDVVKAAQDAAVLVLVY